jgi:hypothetical protein
MSAAPATYAAIFVDDLRGVAIREHLHALFGKNPYVAGDLAAQRKTDFNAGAMSVLDHIERQIARAMDRPNTEEA